jgi:hypothetical protein
MLSLFIGFSLSVLYGCNSTTEKQIESVDRSDSFFDRSKLLDVRIELSPSDWDELRTQERTDFELLPPDCDFPPSPFTWFNASVTIEGEEFPLVEIRKKGFFGSMSDTKPSLKIDLQEFVEDQNYLDVERLTLNNSIQDESYVRQCLTYDMFRDAGHPAPRCNFAHVFVNDVDMGVYVNLEALKKPFLERNFEDGSGTLFEGTLSDFRDGWIGTFQQKTNEEQDDKSKIEALSSVLDLPDEQLEAELKQLVELDAFYDFWAIETMTAHWDGYAGNTNNFYIYDNPSSGKFRFIPWGADGTFQQPYMLFEDELAPRSINAAGKLARRLYLNPNTQAVYLSRLLSLLDTHWNEEELTNSMTEMSNVFGPAVLEDEISQVQDALNETQSFINTQAELIRQEILDGPVVWETDLRGGFCEEGEYREYGTELSAFIPLDTGQGDFEYYRSSEEGVECYFTGDITMVEPYSDCSDECEFAYELNIDNIVEDPNFNCTSSEIDEFSGTHYVGHSTIELGVEDDIRYFKLLGSKDGDPMQPIDDSYSAVATFDTEYWFFGIFF